MMAQPFRPPLERVPVKKTRSPDTGARLLASGTAVGLPAGELMVKLLALVLEAMIVPLELNTRMRTRA